MTRQDSVWIIDDDESIRWVLEKAFQQAGMTARCFSGAGSALDELREETPDVVITDIRMSGLSGLKLLETISHTLPTLPVIVMTAHSDLDSAVAAYQGGAFEYLPKPFDVDHAVGLARYAIEHRRQGQVAHAEHAESAPEILGAAPAMQEVFRAIGRLSGSHITVLINGESGTGKELVARALHNHSPRARNAFIALNIAAIPAGLLESELFGHERGAFTGALTQRRGRFEQADGGTLFLDEIGEMPLGAQAKLLRVLEGGWMRPVGAVREHQVDVRIVAATHRNLALAVEQGRFRDDLLYRLDVLAVSLPGLAGRCDDITVLARHFLHACRADMGSAVDGFETEALCLLHGYAFPGNVRELRNIIQSAAVFARGPRIGALDLPERVRRPGGRGQGASACAALPEPAGTGDLVTLEERKRAYVREVLRRVRGNKRAAARILGIERRTLYRWLTPS